MALRTEFPERGASYHGGISDGWEYRSVFAAGTVKKSYAMIKAFLREEGYAEIPLPKNVEELRMFRLRPKKQMRLFDEDGYVHNPLKILFPPPGTEKRGALVLLLYNENAEDHLLRFHGVLKAEKVE